MSQTNSMKFVATVRNESGESSVTREGTDRFEVARELRKEGFTVVVVKENGGGGLHNIKFDSSQFFRRVSQRDKILFAQNLAAMLSAGLPLSRALGVIERQTRSQWFQSILHSVSTGIDRGESLNMALSKYPKVFAPEFVAIVAAGEESGTLPQSLTIIGDQMDKAYTLKKKIRGAMMYPSVVVSAMVIIGVIMMVYVVPTLTDTFAQYGAELPLATRLVIALSNALSRHFVSSMFVLALCGSGLYFYLKSASGKRLVDHVSVKLPYIGTLAIEAQSAYALRTLSALIGAGVDIVEALTVSKRVVTNSLHAEVLERAAKDVQQGAPLSMIFKKETDLYPPLVSAMMEVGEETGKLAEMLRRAALFYEDDVDTATKNLSTIVEPILMIFIGAAVGFFALAIMQPMYSIGQNI